jgi:hypothetical protein
MFIAKRELGTGLCDGRTQLSTASGQRGATAERRAARYRQHGCAALCSLILRRPGQTEPGRQHRRATGTTQAAVRAGQTACSTSPPYASGSSGRRRPARRLNSWNLADRRHAQQPCSGPHALPAEPDPVLGWREPSTNDKISRPRSPTPKPAVRCWAPRGGCARGGRTGLRPRRAVDRSRSRRGPRTKRPGAGQTGPHPGSAGRRPARAVTVRELAGKRLRALGVRTWRRGSGGGVLTTREQVIAYLIAGGASTRDRRAAAPVAEDRRAARLERAPQGRRSQPGRARGTRGEARR